MKRILTSLAFIFATLSAYCQIIELGTIQSLDRKCSIFLLTSGEKPVLSIDVRKDEYDSKKYLSLRGLEDMQLFYESMLLVKDKYLEWERIASENNVEKMTKQIPVSFPNAFLMWKLGTSAYSSKPDNILIPLFHTMVINGKRFCGVSFSGKVECKMNEYIKEEFSLHLTDINQIDALIKAVSPENIAEKYTNKNSVDSLFK